MARDIYSSVRPKAPTKDFYSIVRPIVAEKKDEDTIWNRAKNYFTSNKFGEALVQQQKSGGFAGAPALTPEQGKTVVAKTAGIAAVEAVAAAYAPAYVYTQGVKGLTSLTRLLQAGTSGAVATTTESLIEKGELLNKEEIAKEGATWAAIDAALQVLSVTYKGAKNAYDINKAVGDIAAKEGIPKVQVWKDLWNSTKKYTKQKFGKGINRPSDVGLHEAEVFEQTVKRAEKEGLKAIAYEEPKRIEYKPEVAAKEEVKNVPAETKMGKGTGIIFKTAKGSTYEVEHHGGTTRDKAARPEHPGEKGLQPTSEITYYVDPKDVNSKLSLQQTMGGKKHIVQISEDEIGVMYGEGKDKGKIEKRTVTKFKTKPEKGLIPVETWKLGEMVHFGNPIVEVNASEKPVVKTNQKSVSVAPKVEQPKSKTALQPSGEQPEHQKDFSKAKLTEQKHYIIDKIDEALAKPTKTDKITIKVPDDGVFKINNSPDNLKLAKARVEKNWPVKPLTVKQGQPVEHKHIASPKKLREEKERPLAKKIRPEGVPPTFVFRQPVMGKAQAAKRSDILKLFRKAFNDPIRLGKISQRGAAGIHKLWPKVSRLLRDNDIESAAHEIGHNLHTTLYGGDAKTPSEQRVNISKALYPYLDELKPLALYEPWGMEGFAEFTRLYVTNTALAKKYAPKFYNKFESDLKAYPEMQNALLESRDYYEKYLQGTPESRIDAQTSYAEETSRLDNLIEWAKDAFNLDRLKTNLLDDVFPAKRIVAEAFGIPVKEVENLKDPRNLYRSLRVLKGAIGKADVYLQFETFDPITLARTGKGLRDILKKLPDDEAYKEFNRYLIARRAVEKSGQKIETGINLGDALEVQKNFGSKYDNLAQQLDHYNDQLLQYAMKSGLISREQYSQIRKNNMMYTPFQRVMEEEKGGRAATSGKLQATRPIKRMTGSTRDIIAPLESIIKNTYAIIVNSEKNLSGKVLSELAKMKDMGSYVEQVPTPTKLKAKLTGSEVEAGIVKHLKATGQTEYLELNQEGKWKLREDLEDLIPDLILKFGAGTYPAGENIVTVFYDGKPKYFQVSPEINEMWTKGIQPYTADLITKVLRVPARTLRAGAILNPKFIQKNFIRDTWGGILFTKYGKGIKDPSALFLDTLYEPLAMLSVSARQGPLYVEWMKAGGGMSTMQSLDRNNVMKKLKEVRDGYSPLQVMKWLRKVGEISEESNRLAEFGRAMKVEADTRLGREISAFAARDLSIDFAKMGLQTKALNQIIPFFNATIQGGDKLLRSAMSDKDRKEFIARVLGFVVVPSLIFAWLNKDDDRVKEFQEQEKDFNFITFVGGTAIKIPVPFETGVIAHGLVQRLYNYMMTKDNEAFEGYMGSIKDAMMPNFLPSLVNPFVEAECNKNFFTGGRLIPYSKEGMISKYQYNNYTSLTARLIGRALSYMIGQDTRNKYASPAIIDHFIRSWTGGLGRMVVGITDSALEAIGLGDKIPKPDQSIIDKFELNAFAARYPRANTASIEKFYNNYADAKARQKSYKYAEKMELDSEKSVAKGYERTERLYDMITLERGYKAIRESQKAINNIFNDPSIDSKEKREIIDQLYLQQIEFAKSANEDIKKYRLDQK